MWIVFTEHKCALILYICSHVHKRSHTATTQFGEEEVGCLDQENLVVTGK